MAASVLGACGLVYFADLTHDFLILHIARMADRGSPIPPLLVRGVDRLGGFVTIAMAITLVVNLVTYMMWVHRAHSNLVGAQLIGLKYTPGQVVWGYFVPFLNLVRPIKAMWELERGSAVIAKGLPYGGAWEPTEGRWRSALWWTASLAGSSLNRLSARHPPSGPTIDSLRRSSTLSLAGDFMACVALVLLMVLIVEITEKHRRARLALPVVSVRENPPAPAPAPAPAATWSDVRPRRIAVWLLVIAVMLAAVGLGIRGRKERTVPVATDVSLVPVQALTHRGDVEECVTSRDGRLIAYVVEGTSRNSIRLLEKADGKDVEIYSGDTRRPEGLAFDPDGKALEFLLPNRDAPEFMDLMEVPSRGGEAKWLLTDVDSRPAFSPGGRKIAFCREDGLRGRDHLVIHDLDVESQEYEIDTYYPTHLIDVAWSRDGGQLAVLEWVVGEGEISSEVALLEPMGSAHNLRTVARFPAARLSSLAWLPNGKSIALSGLDCRFGVTSQIQILNLSNNLKTVLTDDVNDYGEVSVSSQANLVTTRQRREGEVWVANLNSGPDPEITPGPVPEDGWLDVYCARTGALAYRGRVGGDWRLLSVPWNGGEAKPLTPAGGNVLDTWSYPGGFVFERVSRDEPARHIWTVDIDGTGLRQLTHGDGEYLVDVACDGRTMVYTRSDSAGYWMAPVEGGEARLVGGDPNFSYAGRFSIDGRTFLANERLTSRGRFRAEIHIFSVETGKHIRRAQPVGGVLQPRLGSEPGSFYFLDADDPNHNLCLRHFDRRPVVRITKLTEGTVDQFEFSPDRLRVALAVNQGTGSSVWVIGADGAGLRKIAVFDTLQVIKTAWAPDGNSLILHAGRVDRDVVALNIY